MDLRNRRSNLHAADFCIVCHEYPHTHYQLPHTSTANGRLHVGSRVLDPKKSIVAVHQSYIFADIHEIIILDFTKVIIESQPEPC